MPAHTTAPGLVGLCTTEIHRLGDVWFSENDQGQEEAKRVCRRCPVREPCEREGLSLDEDARGVWGGLSTSDRRARRPTPPAPAGDPDALPASKRRRLAPRRPCDSEQAFKAHLARGEECPRCREAHDKRVFLERTERLQEAHAQGGTPSGVDLHRLLSQEPCPACSRAHAQMNAAYDAEHRPHRPSRRARAAESKGVSA